MVTITKGVQTFDGKIPVTLLVDDVETANTLVKMAKDANVTVIEQNVDLNKSKNKTTQDKLKQILSRELNGYSRKVKVFPKIPDCVPGTVIDDSGEIVGSASTSANVVLEYKDADTTPVAVLVANTNIHIKDFSLVCDDVAKAKELLSADPAVYFSTGKSLPTT